MHLFALVPDFWGCGTPQPTPAPSSVAGHCVGGAATVEVDAMGMPLFNSMAVARPSSSGSVTFIHSFFCKPDLIPALMFCHSVADLSGHASVFSFFCWMEYCTLPSDTYKNGHDHTIRGSIPNFLVTSIGYCTGHEWAGHAALPGRRIGEPRRHPRRRQQLMAGT